MLNKESNQKATGINNSQVNQAGGNINITNNGIHLGDIIPLVENLVDRKIQDYFAQGLTTVKNRRDEFGRWLLDAVSQNAKDRLFRFDDPAVQYSTMRAALGYIKSGDKQEGEELIDLIIERINEDGRTTNQNVIDQAIEVLPTLSHNALSLLILLAYRALIFNGMRSNYMNWLKCIEPILDVSVDITPIDIAYLQQANCTYGMSGFSHDKYESELIKNEDLFFRHDITGEQYDIMLNIFGFEGYEHDIRILHVAFEDFKRLFSILSFNQTQHKASFKLCSSTNLNDIINKPEFDKYRDKIQQTVKLGSPFTEQEVKEFLTGVNPKWEHALKILDREDVRSAKLTLLGNFIASRKLSKLSGQKIGLDIFYNK